MPSTASPLLKVELQALGENLNTWGDTKLNEALKRLEEAIADVKAVTVDADVNLTTNNFIANQARSAGFILTGAGGFSITCPATSKLYLVKNDCTDAVTFTHGSGDTVSVAAGQVCWIATDGTDFFKAEPNDFANQKLLRVAAGTADTDGVNKGQMDTALALKADLSGGNTFAGLQSFGDLLKYTSDLSGSYDDRSLVDKAYVNAVALGSVSVSFAWADVTGKPTTIAGFGITDAYTKTEADARYQPLDSDLTSIAALTTTARGRANLTESNPIQVDNTDSPVTAMFGDTILVDSSTAAVEIDLPAATAGSLPITIVDDGGASATNNITLDPNGSETINGETSIEVDVNYQRLTLVPFAGVWRFMQ